MAEGIAFERERWEAIETFTKVLDTWLQPTLNGFRVRKIIDETFDKGTPVWAVEHEKNLLEGSRPSSTRETVYNAVKAYNPDKPAISALAVIEDKTNVNPLRWNGPFGQRPALYASTLLGTTTAAAQAASTRLKSINTKSLLSEVVTVCNPAIEPGDIITVVWPNKVSERVLVRKVTLPLTPGSMNLTVMGAPTDTSNLLYAEEFSVTTPDSGPITMRTKEGK
jgi:hypothetical protein